ncbi:hypothetical protein KSS87_010047, partial [Heliosperma pusillum]
SKTSDQALPSRIKRVFYMSSEGKNLLHEVFPAPNPAVLEQLDAVDCIVYTMGSLFTSICPSLVLIGIGEIISARPCRKILLLNGTHDRETTSFTASCFVTAITDALNRTHGNFNNCLNHTPNKYINAILVPRNGEVAVDLSALKNQGIQDVVIVDSVNERKAGITFDPKALIQSLANLLDSKFLGPEYLALPLFHLNSAIKTELQARFNFLCKAKSQRKTGKGYNSPIVCSNGGKNGFNGATNAATKRIPTTIATTVGLAG